jgi:hypothetical protein
MQMGELLNSMVNSSGGAMANPAVLKQEIFNENRRLMLEMMH